MIPNNGGRAPRLHASTSELRARAEVGGEQQCDSRPRWRSETSEDDGTGFLVEGRVSSGREMTVVVVSIVAVPAVLAVLVVAAS